MIYILWIALSIAAGILAHNKGRSGMGFFMLSLVLSPLVGLISAAIARPNAARMEVAELASGESKRCPHCAEIIKRAAKICRFCNRDVAATAAEELAAPVSDPRDEPTAEGLMVQLGITYDGARYKYKHYYYAKLDDAVAYAKTAQQRFKRLD